MKIVLANGCFDCLHPGHLAYLKAARKLGDYLIVSVTEDKAVGKGAGRPVFGEIDRLEMVRALRCVSAAFLTESAEYAIRAHRPTIYVKGKEYEGRLPEAALVEELGGRVVFLDTKPVYSSTRILSGLEYNDRISAHRRRAG